MGTAPFDSAKAEAFAGRFVNALNDAALCLMVSIGHRLGLLDAMRDRAPETSHELAHRTGFNERYVREWLGALTTAGVLEVDPDGPRFRLPAEHAACSSGRRNRGPSRSTSSTPEVVSAPSHSRT